MATSAMIHALVPLAVLETLRRQDVPEPDGLDEFHVELTTKRLGMSHTVEKQIDRYEALVARDQRVTRDEVVALFRLAGRRPDADLLFAEAGRRAGTAASARLGSVRQGVHGGLPRFLRRRYGWRLARAVLREVFDVQLAKDGGEIVAEASEPLTVEATASGAACAFLGSAIAAVLRRYTDFDGAVVHERCRGRGADRCRWGVAVRGKVAA